MIVWSARLEGVQHRNPSALRWLMDRLAAKKTMHDGYTFGLDSGMVVFPVMRSVNAEAQSMTAEGVYPGISAWIVHCVCCSWL